MKQYWWQAKQSKLGISILIVGGGVILSLFSHWEMSGETWGYWFFARIFKETGKFIIFDRSPLYILYLNMFHWLGYPACVIVEYLVTTCIVVVALVLLFRPYLGLLLASFSVFLWIPFLQISEPSVQKLALACSCLGMVARRLKDRRLRFVISYMLLGLAFMFRSNYIIFIFIFVLWDILKVLRKKGVKVLLLELRPRPRDWPILVVVGLLVYFLTMQSTHPLNNAFFATTTWFPSKSKTLSEGAFIQQYNVQYISDKYGTFKEKDFYFTHQELFGQANTVLGMILANPSFVTKQLIKNIKSVIPIAVDTTMLHKIYLKLSQTTFLPRFSVGWLCLFSLAIILHGAFHTFKDKFMILFVVGNIFLVVSCVFILPRERYMLPFIPVFILSAYWWDLQLHRILKTRYKRWIPITIPLFLVLFSNGVTGWGRLMREVAGDICENEVQVLQARNYSMKSSYKLLEPLVRGRKGVMALESAFVGAFMDVPLFRIYDIWEIPPFGSLRDSVYQGLSSDRIDCILVSHRLATEVGLATNFHIRYENYIKPYVKYLQGVGAETYKIDKFGEAVILSSPGKSFEINQNDE